MLDDVADPERPELADQLAAAVVAWRGGNAKYHAGAKIWVGGDTLLVNGARLP